jgi:hypothetical protein
MDDNPTLSLVAVAVVVGLLIAGLVWAISVSENMPPSTGGPISSWRDRQEARLQEKHPAWSVQDIDRALKHDVWLGMTREQARESWGSPTHISKTAVLYGVYEVWTYERIGYHLDFLDFENDILISWQN